jgi:hypothetical protein
MYVKCANGATKRLKVPEIDEFVEFSENNIAQVTQDVGASLIEHYDAIEEHTTED